METSDDFWRRNAESPQSNAEGPQIEQRQAAQQAKTRAGGARSAAVRYRFIARGGPEEDPPPLARLLRGGGGKGGAARLRLYLSLLWLSRNDDAPRFEYPAHQWARLLGFDSPDTAGARRVQQALRWLDEQAFVRLQHRQGASSAIHLLSDAGTGRPYQAPGLAMKRLAVKAQREEHLYVQLPAGLWTKGWISDLSGAAVAMYLVLLHERRGEDKTVWLSPRIGRERYDLSDETRRKGLNELAQHQLVSVRRRPVHQGLFEDHFRSRNVYELNPEDLDRYEPGEQHPWF
ncbi:hypothetical protein FNH09_44935 [Streptomyces adustus]|uniref:Replication initiation protein n=1 Tax=Streptomyces adustus TaxID=1609272 RepID=A0A5N8VTU5_9ACTN|nr:hypothetical protein [Streptomyces adustus]MPY38106.1 hypothetical protein [Streptomyces adustus]